MRRRASATTAHARPMTAVQTLLGLGALHELTTYRTLTHAAA
jgi:hypothetical protein